MNYITIDGDDIGQKITSAYLNNNVHELIRVNDLVQEKTKQIATFLKSQGCEIIFCAADGVAGVSVSEINTEYFYSKIKLIAEDKLSFSVGVGETLRDAYVALLSAKSAGKAQLQNFKNMGQ